MKFENRPLFWSALLFMGGIINAYYFTDNKVLIFILIIVFITLLFTAVDKYFLVFVMVIIFLTGFFLMLNREYSYNNGYSIINYNEKGRCIVKGEIIENLCSLSGKNIYLKPEKVNGRMVKYGLIQLNKNYLPANFNNGQIISLNLKLKTPEPARNPGNFSYKNYLKKKGIYSIGYYAGPVDGDSYRLYCSRRHYCKDFLLKFKEDLIFLTDISVKKPLNEVIKALVLGERENLADVWDEYFSKAGASHLLAISGLHVGFIMLIFIFILQSFKLKVISKNIICTFFMLIYILITGMRASVFRAGLLSIFFLWAPLWERRADLFNICGLTIIINLLINPYLLFTAGFQLSYLVLFMIIFWADIIKNNINKIIAVSAAAQLGSIPVTAYYFNLITPVGILTNIWAIPAVAVIVLIAITGLLLGLINPVFSMVSGTLLNILLNLLKKGIYLMTLIPCGSIEVASPPIPLIIIFYIFLLAIPLIIKRYQLPPDRIKRKYYIILVSSLTIISLIINILIPVFNNNLQIVFLSVGQGDSILIKTPDEKYMLVDGGNREGKNYVLSYLKTKGIKKLDIVFVTHFDFDHAGGIPAILEERQVKLIVLPEKFPRTPETEIVEKIYNTADKRDIPLKFAGCGDYIKHRYLTLKILNPEGSSRLMGANNNSIVIKAKFKNFTALLTGDLEYEGELLLLRKKYNLKCQVLKLGHHGSNSSSSSVFLQKISPLIAIISVGKNNYGHPAQKVIKRVKDMGIKIYRTDRDGAVTISTNGNVYTVKSYIN